MKVIVKSAAIALAMCALASGAAQAADAKDADAGLKVKTVFLDGHGQSSFADKVNKLHADMAAKGWKFHEFDLYTEDGDMKGAFITYTRD